MNNTLTPLQTFNAMTQFLDDYYDKTASDDIAVLVSSMQFLEDYETADPAKWEDWINILGTDQPMTPREGYNAMQRYLAFYADLMSSEGIQLLLEKTKLSDNQHVDNTLPWNTWTLCVDKVLREPKDARSYLQLIK